jgi:hypothetical protein
MPQAPGYPPRLCQSFQLRLDPGTRRMLRTNPFRAVGVMSLEKQGTAGPIRPARHPAVYGRHRSLSTR